MDNKVLVAVGLVVILIVAAAGAYMMIGGEDEEQQDPVALDDAQLKVFGNVNGDRFIDSKDVSILEKLVADAATAEVNPLADANQDGKLDAADVDIVKKVAAGEKTRIFHVNHFDKDGDGYTDNVVVDTAFPIKSAIALGTANNFNLLYSIGIHDEIKGCTKSSSCDSALYGHIYFTDDVVNLGKSSQSIKFEDGKAGASNVIAEQNVTAVIANHSQKNLSNEDDFEAAGLDVVRIASSSADEVYMNHYVMLMGLLFQKVDKAEKYLDASLKIINEVKDKVKDAKDISCVASTMTGYLSVNDSDYRDYIMLLGGDYALEGDWGDSKAIKISEHPEVYTYEFERLIHFRSAINYGQTEEIIQESWDTYTKPFEDWKNSETGNYIVSTTLPIALRVAFLGAALYPGEVSVDYCNDLHQEWMETFYDKTFDLSKMKFIVTPADMA